MRNLHKVPVRTIINQLDEKFELGLAGKSNDEIFKIFERVFIKLEGAGKHLKKDKIFADYLSREYSTILFDEEHNQLYFSKKSIAVQEREIIANAQSINLIRRCKEPYYCCYMQPKTGVLIMRKPMTFEKVDWRQEDDSMAVLMRIDEIIDLPQIYQPNQFAVFYRLTNLFFMDDSKLSHKDRKILRYIARTFDYIMYRVEWDDIIFIKKVTSAKQFEDDEHQYVINVGIVIKSSSEHTIRTMRLAAIKDIDGIIKPLQEGITI